MPRFLIVDDDELSLSILADFFAQFAECDRANDGREAFKLFEAAIASGQPYNLICTDLIMPIVDGRDLTRKVRARENTLPIVDCLRTPIFVISASDSTADIQATILDCDADDYIVKPFKPQQIISLLQKYKIIQKYENEP